MSVVKAIACNVPVMCTKVGGVDDILSKHKVGILLDPYDYEDWKTRLLEILNGKSNIKLLDRDKAKLNFHWPNIADKFVKIYEKLRDA